MIDHDDLSPRLIWTEDGAPRSGRFGDVYFSREDGLAESRTVFLQGCGLPEAWAGRRRFVVAELGFGTGLNIAALLHLWRRTRPPHGRLSIFSVEGFPLSRDEAARALAAWPELANEAGALLDAWPNGAPGFHRMELGDGAVLDLAIGDATWALGQWSGQADVWFLDGFAPSANPAMWSDAVLDGVRARSAPGARLATFTVAGAVRRGLAERGFDVEKQPGHGRKRERLEARLPGTRAEPSTPRVAIIGAGIAGASLARAFEALCAPAALVAPETDDAGSGFAAALVTPRLDAGDDEIAALYAQALRRAGALYDNLPSAVTARGVIQLEQAPRDAARFDKVEAQRYWAAGEMQRLSAREASERLGEPVETGALLMAGARAIQPGAALDAWLPMSERVSARVERLEPSSAGWRLMGPGGPLLEAEVVVLASAVDAARLWPALPLSPVAGQAEWVEGPPLPAAAAWGGYVAPGHDGWLFGATHERGVAQAITTETATARNHQTLASRLPHLASRMRTSQSRAAVRAATPDRLPLAGRLGDGLFVLTGLGSRGFCAAPLLGEHVAALAVGAPSPLPAALANRSSANRFSTLRNPE